MHKVKILEESELTDEICVVVGTRPGIIKMSPIVIELMHRRVPFFLIHTGQHYSYEMDRRFFEDLELPSPRHHLPKCRTGSYHGEQTSHMLAGIEKALLKERPKTVLVCGDANTNLAGALAARKLHITLGHVESGLRSFDWRMPEEHNRVIIDHISDYLFVPTSLARQNLLTENIKGKIYLTGNCVVDALSTHLEISKGKSRIIGELSLENKNYILVTLHREENVDNFETLSSIIQGLQLLEDLTKLPKIFPIHPRTLDRLNNFQLLDQLSSIENLEIISPLGYLDFLQLLNGARLVLTDSGGIQEESCILKVPCVTLRENTERPETVKVGANLIGGTVPQKILHAVTQIWDRSLDWSNPFGDGQAARRIVDICLGNDTDEWIEKY